MSDFDDSGSGIDSQVAGDADRASGFLVDHRVEERIIAEAGGGHPCAVLVESGERAIGEVRPIRTLGVLKVGLVQVGGVAIRIDGFNATEAALHRRA